MTSWRSAKGHLPQRMRPARRIEAVLIEEREHEPFEAEADACRRRRLARIRLDLERVAEERAGEVDRRRGERAARGVDDGLVLRRTRALEERLRPAHRREERIGRRHEAE